MGESERTGRRSEAARVSSAAARSRPFDYFHFRSAIALKFHALREEAPALAARYQNAKPFPFIVMDDFLPIDVAETVWAEFPDEDSDVWRRLPTDDQKGKLVTTDEERLPPATRALVQELNSGAFLRILEVLTGIPDLIADTKLIGGGLHRIRRGGRLGVHVDFSHHPNGLNRRLNLLLYLNKDWKEEYGGHLEFWSSDLRTCQQRILPIFNRCAVFSTTPISYHGHPEPLSCPPTEARRSLALYYFTKGGSAAEEVEHNTLFRSRPGERFSWSNFVVRTASSGVVQDLLPPILYKTMKRFWNKHFSGVRD